MKRSALAGLLALSASVAFAQDPTTAPAEQDAQETAQADICQGLLAYVTAPPPAVRRAAPAASAAEADPDAAGAGGPSQAPGAAAPASAVANLNLPGEQPAPDTNEAPPAPPGSGAPAGNAGGDSPGPVDPNTAGAGPAPAPPAASNQPTPSPPAGGTTTASAGPAGATPEPAAPPPPPPPLEAAWVISVEEAQQLAETGDQMACRSKVRELRLAGLPIPARLALTDVIAAEGQAPRAGAE